MHIEHSNYTGIVSSFHSKGDRKIICTSGSPALTAQGGSGSPVTPRATRPRPASSDRWVARPGPVQLPPLTLASPPLPGPTHFSSSMRKPATTPCRHWTKEKGAGKLARGFHSSEAGSRTRTSAVVPGRRALGSGRHVVSLSPWQRSSPEHPEAASRTCAKRSTGGRLA